MDKFSLARLMGHSSPRVAERYYIHVTESHVSAGFGKFVKHQAEIEERAKQQAAQRAEEEARKLVASRPATDAIQ